MTYVYYNDDGIVKMLSEQPIASTGNLRSALVPGTFSSQPDKIIHFINKQLTFDDFPDVTKKKNLQTQLDEAKNNPDKLNNVIQQLFK